MIKDVIIGLENIGEDFCHKLIRCVLDNDLYIDDAYVNNSVFSVFREVLTQIILIIDAPSNHEYFTQLRGVPDFFTLGHIGYLDNIIVREYFVELSLSLGVEIYDLVKKHINVTDTRKEIFFVSTTLHTLIVGVSDKPSNAILEFSL